MNFRNKLAQLMYGRYGIDKLFYVFFALYVILVGLNRFTHLWILQIIALALIVVSFMRVFSKNINKRQSENAIVEKYWVIINQKYKLYSLHFKERKTHLYHRCPNCKAILRLPKQKGKHTAFCPRCKHQFPVRVWF